MNRIFSSSPHMQRSFPQAVLDIPASRHARHPSIAFANISRRIAHPIGHSWPAKQPPARLSIRWMKRWTMDRSLRQTELSFDPLTTTYIALEEQLAKLSRRLFRLAIDLRIDPMAARTARRRTNHSRPSQKNSLPKMDLLNSPSSTPRSRAIAIKRN